MTMLASILRLILVICLYSLALKLKARLELYQGAVTSITALWLYLIYKLYHPSCPYLPWQLAQLYCKFTTLSVSQYCNNQCKIYDEDVMMIKFKIESNTIATFGTYSRISDF